MTLDDARVIVVDAANVVGSRPDGWWRDRPGAARRLLERITRARENLQGGIEIVVVLEGAARRAVSGTGPEEFGHLRVVLAPGSGDDMITSVATQLMETEGSVLVVTADRGLRERVEAAGATTVGPRWLLDQLGTGHE